MNTSETNKSILLRMFESIESKGFPAQSEFFAPEPRNHGFQVTREDIRAILEDIVATFPDVKLKPLQLVAENDWVVARCLFSGTHTGVGRHPFVHHGLLAGVPPTGRSFEVQHIHMMRFKDGLIIEHFADRDDIGMIRQLGLIPQPAAA